jgi:glutaredoxin-related protein
MERYIIAQDRVHPAIRETIVERNREIVEEVEAAIAKNDVVVVGMAQNPHPKRARKLLRERSVAFEYLEYGSYLKKWRLRNALKMWTGWPTFPMVFVKGTLVGGASELGRLAESGELEEMLSA